MRKRWLTFLVAAMLTAGLGGASEAIEASSFAIEEEERIGGDGGNCDAKATVSRKADLWLVRASIPEAHSVFIVSDSTTSAIDHANAMIRQPDGVWRAEIPISFYDNRFALSVTTSDGRELPWVQPEIVKEIDLPVPGDAFVLHATDLPKWKHELSDATMGTTTWSAQSGDMSISCGSS